MRCDCLEKVVSRAVLVGVSCCELTSPQEGMKPLDAWHPDPRLISGANLSQSGQLLFDTLIRGLVSAAVWLGSIIIT